MYILKLNYVSQSAERDHLYAEKKNAMTILK